MADSQERKRTCHSMRVEGCDSRSAFMVNMPDSELAASLCSTGACQVESSVITMDKCHPISARPQGDSLQTDDVTGCRV